MLRLLMRKVDINQVIHNVFSHLQLVANILLCLATGCIGAAGSLFQDRLNRRTVMETKSALIAKAKIEMAYKDKVGHLVFVFMSYVCSNQRGFLNAMSS